ncbi:thiol:disulfide interchange protein [Marinicauda salina]|uniref:Thiol:disulfide interchange protein n=1 Tax=Marinicauda salina TaxID=2135793 RepID=A0A2U2BW83_9PROT|nr:DsbE family thiol:disulfide interchange protein [Marinicauda salina]PWE18262.1 thiol:disulfide interchange protein [Marinicauda salina]
MNRVLLWAPVGSIAILLVVFAIALLRPSDSDGGDPLIGAPLPALPLTDFPGGRGDFDPDAVDGPYLLNVWASWCAPCRIEHPLLMALREDGVPIYGVVYRDDPADANAFLEQLGDPFAGLAADAEGRAAIELGLTGAPETFVIDEAGIVRARWRGAIDETTWRRSLAPEFEAARARAGADGETE